jgi:hypothetical protein
MSGNYLISKELDKLLKKYSNKFASKIFRKLPDHDNQSLL